MHSNVSIERFFQFFIQPKKRKRWQLSKLVRQIMQPAMSLGLLVGIIFIGVLCLILYSYQKNKSDIDSVQKLASTIRPNDGNFAQEIFALKEAISEHSFRWYRVAYGANASHQNLLHLLNERLLSNTKSHCVPYMVRFVHNQLSQQLKGERWLEVFETFRIYLMLTNKEAFNKNAVFEWFSARKAILAEALPIEDFDITNILKSITHKMFENVQIDRQLYERIITLVQSLAFSQSVYNSIANQLCAKPDLMIAQFASRRVLALLHPSIEKVSIPYLFTKAGWGDFESCQKNIINAFLKNQHLGKILNLENLRQSVEDAREIYQEAYEIELRNIWSRIKFRRVQDVVHSLAMLKVLSEELPSVFHFIKRVEKGIFIGEDYFDKMDLVSSGVAKVKELGGQQALKKFNAYMPINQEVAQRAQDAMRENLGALVQCAAQLSSSANKDKACHKLLTSVLEAESPVFKGEVLASTLVHPIDIMYKELILNFRDVLHRHSAAYINSAWQKDIYIYYVDRIQNKYPFNAFNYQNQLSIEDFSAFFGPDGKFCKFKKAYLEGVQMPFLPQAKRLLHFFDQVQSHWFGENAQLKVAFSITNVTIDSSTKHVDLHILGTDIRISNSNLGPNEFMWTNKASDMAKAEFLNTKNSVTSVIYSGPWAWYKLLALDAYNAGETLRRTIKASVGEMGFFLHFHSKFLPLRNVVGMPTTLISINTYSE